MLKPTLSATTLEPLEYLRTAFDRDLERVTTGTSHRHVRLSVASFCPDWPKVPMYAEPARVFHGSDDSLWFLCSLFSTQLVDQASHYVDGVVRSTRAGTRGEIVIVGVLGSYWNVVSPAFLLLVLSLYRRPVRDEGVAEALATLLRATLADFPFNQTSRNAVLGAARDSVTVLAVPDSIRGFVPHGDGYPHQPDHAFVEMLRHSAHRVLVEASA
jgi:hypothetical protein